MSKKRKDRRSISNRSNKANAGFTEHTAKVNDPDSRNFSGRRLILIFLAIPILAVAAFGSMIFLERNADQQNTLDPKDRSFLSKINPFVVSPSPTPTPVAPLAKEYIYAGSKLVAIQDAETNTTPPADLAVWRPSTGVWYVLGGPGSQQWIEGWGNSTDIPVQGDYDGDGKTDFAIFRPSTGDWWILKSSDGTSYAPNFGQSGDIVAQADYDGDGKTDIAVFREDTPSTGNGTWYILPSSTNSPYNVPYGSTGDVPTPADIDGDGKADQVLWRASNTTFYAYRSSDQQYEYPTMSASGIPVVADYDGDGSANFAIKDGNVWRIMNAAKTAISTTTFENATDIPVPNDYDGDGKVDIAVWRDSNGNWYIKQSTDNTTRNEAWGQSGDIPVPAYFRR